MTSQPGSEQLRKAVRWISNGQDYSAAAIAEAAFRFDLSPLDEEFLISTLLHADRRKKPEHD